MNSHVCLLATDGKARYTISPREIELNFLYHVTFSYPTDYLGLFESLDKGYSSWQNVPSYSFVAV